MKNKYHTTATTTKKNNEIRWANDNEKEKNKERIIRRENFQMFLINGKD